MIGFISLEQPGEVLRLFFWNLARKSLADLIYAAIQLNGVDVAAFAEVDQLDFQRLAELLDDHYQTVETMVVSRKLV